MLPVRWPSLNACILGGLILLVVTLARGYRLELHVAGQTNPQRWQIGHRVEIPHGAHLGVIPAAQASLPPINYRQRTELKSGGPSSSEDNPGSTANNTVVYDVVIASALIAGLAILLTAASSEGGINGAYGAISLGVAGLAAILRPSVSPSSTGSTASKEAEKQDETVSILPSIASLTAAEWREKYEHDYMVSLWVEDSFNASSRTIPSGFGTGEGPSKGNVPVYNVKMTDREGKLWDLQVPEDRYILWEAEDRGMKLPFACRAGCCTTCAVKIDKGVMVQDQALGIAPEYRKQGYGLMCVGYPRSDLVMNLIEEDELYEKQFGEYFAKGATDPNAPSVRRDDFALEIALGDE